MDPKSATRTYALKPAAMAAIVGTATTLYHPDTVMKLPGFGTTLPVGVVAAGATFVAAEVAALINEYLFPHIPVINAFEAPAHTALNIGTVAAVSAGVDNYLSPGVLQDIPMTEIAILAAAAEVGSSYLIDDLLVPMWNQWQSR